MIVLIAALLMGCGGETINTRMNLGPLPASASTPCGPILKLGSDDPVAVWNANAYHMRALADCDVSRRSAVDAYEKARAANNAKVQP